MDRLRSVGLDAASLGGKLVIGSSAGVNCLSEYFWSSTRGIAAKGLGILDINPMVHFGARTLGNSTIVRSADDWLDEKRQFQDTIGADAAITCLPEATFVVVEK
jgi:CobQ-like glutamine amidotransferase family enzyme